MDFTSSSSSSSSSSAKDSTWWLFTLPSLFSSSTSIDPYLFVFVILSTSLAISMMTWALSPGGLAWSPDNRTCRGYTPIEGPRGLPFLGSILTLTNTLPHRALERMSRASASTRQLMAFSIGSTPAVVSSDPTIAKEILTSPSFSNRPLKRSARELMFARAIGFAPAGSYWRLLRRIASTHLFCPRRIAAHEPGRQSDTRLMLSAVQRSTQSAGSVQIRPHLQLAALNNIMGSVFGKRYGDATASTDSKLEELQQMVREGFELLGAFNWSDHLPWLAYFYDPDNVNKRCSLLVPRVRKFVKEIIDEHRHIEKQQHLRDNADFVDVLLSLEKLSDGFGDKLEEDDMIAVLWEMIFRGTDTTALLTEWAMAELVLHPRVQEELYAEIDSKLGPIRAVTEADVARMPYLQAVVKETLRLHPPGPLLSWARLSTEDVLLSNGMVVPAGTTAMVNMWAITHDETVWARAEKFEPERFLHADVDVRGSDLRLAPFGAGRRVCPGKNLGLVTVSLWIAELVHRFKWCEAEGSPVDLTEVLKLSCEMENPLVVVAVPREGIATGY